MGRKADPEKDWEPRRVVVSNRAINSPFAVAEELTDYCYQGQEVVTGNIIYRQRGTKWFPGENCGMGRDHTLFATQPGYVQYYRDPAKHPKRQYVGVVFSKTQTLPTPPNAARRRRLGMIAVPRSINEAVDNDEVGSFVPATQEKLSNHELRSLTVPQRKTMAEKARAETTRNIRMSSNYMYRESNREIGRTAEKEGVYVRPFERGDRFLAWRKKSVVKAREAKQNLGSNKQKKDKKDKKRKPQP